MTSQRFFGVGQRKSGFIARGVSGRRNLSEAQSERRREEGKGTERRRESQTGWTQGPSWNSKDRHTDFSFILWTHRACGWMDMFIYTGCLQERWGLIILTNGANFNSSLFCKFLSSLHVLWINSVLETFFSFKWLKFTLRNVSFMLWQELVWSPNGMF